MRLALSSAAAPDASFDELLAACARRGFAAVELEAGHAHGISPSAGLEAASAVAERAARVGIGIAAVRLDDVASVLDPRTPRLAVALGAPVVVRVEGEIASTVRAAAPLFAEAGATLLLASSGDVDEIGRLRGWVEAASTGALGLAWDVTPGDPQIRVPAAVLEAAAGHIRHIRLHGGGPETMGQEGLGVGRLMSALALSGYTGTLALAPSDPRFRYAWGAWLGRKGGWGCGSKTGSDTVVIDSGLKER